jgi:microcin C transport system substrate-binding protein
MQSFRVAYWNKFSRPEVSPPYGLPLNAWWIDREKLAEIRKEGQSD